MHGRDEIIDLLNTSYTTQTTGTQAYHCTTQNKAVHGKGVGEKWGSGSLPTERFARATHHRISENAFLEHGIEVAIIIDLYAYKEN